LLDGAVGHPGQEGRVQQCVAHGSWSLSSGQRPELPDIIAYIPPSGMRPLAKSPIPLEWTYD
jgi:hypothetical protein